MNMRDVMPRIFRLLGATLFGVIILSSGGNALAATMPVVTNLDNKYDLKGLAKPGGIAVNQAKERIYVTDTIDQKIRVFSFKGRKINELRTVNVPNAIAVGTDGKLYVVGYSNGAYTVFKLDDETGVSYGPINLQAGIKMPNDLVVDSRGNVYVVDSATHTVKVFDNTGILKGTYGPYAFYRDNETLKDSITLTSSTYARTRHSFVVPAGIAIDESQNEMYVQFREVVEREDSTSVSSCSSYLDSATGKYLTPVGDYYKVAVIGLQDGALNQQKSMLLRNFLTDSASCINTYSSGAVINPKGLTSDNMGRLYAADGYWGVRVFDLSNGDSLDKLQFGNIWFNSSNNKINSKFDYNLATEYIGGIQYRVITVDFQNYGYPVMPDGNYAVNFQAILKADGTEFDPSQIIVANKRSTSFTFKIPASWVPASTSWSHGYSLSPAPAHGLAFDTVNKRLLATEAGGNSVDIYGIDGGSNPGNRLPEPPVLLSPANGSIVGSDRPLFEVRASYDADGDPLIYTYELNGAVIGNSGTTYAPTTSLAENTLYGWRAKSNDGDGDSPWSAAYEFCVNVKNDPPSMPEVISPKDDTSASPFGTYLSWNPSADPDCGDTVKYYRVEVSADPAFGYIAHSANINGTSIKLGDLASDLVKGSIYYWRVKAVDNNGGESAYSAASFTYKTTVARFESDQAGARVYIDGNYGYFGRLLGTTPFEVQNVTPGSHFVTFIKAGYEPHHTVINVSDPVADEANSSVNYKATMAKASRIKPPATAVTIDIKVAAYSAPFVVDYNNDGVKDVVAGGDDGKVYLYLSEKQTVDGAEKVIPLVSKGAIQVYDSGTETYSDMNVVSRAVPFVADYDNDGRKDMLLGSGEGLVYLYINEGTDDAPVFTPAGTLKDKSGNNIKVGSNSAPVIVDYNGDGRKDLVIGSSYGTLELYINNGDDAAPEFDAHAAVKTESGDLNIQADSKAFFTDWNSDGKKDLVVGGNTVNLFLNVGTDESPDFRSISGLQNWIKEKKRERGNREFIPFLGYSQDLGDLAGGRGAASPFIVDWDGSTARDVVVGNGSGGVDAYITE